MLVTTAGTTCPAAKYPPPASERDPDTPDSSVRSRSDAVMRFLLLLLLPLAAAELLPLLPSLLPRSLMMQRTYCPTENSWVRGGATPPAAHAQYNHMHTAQRCSDHRVVGPWLEELCVGLVGVPRIVQSAA
jgi:hypothetical protein